MAFIRAFKWDNLEKMSEKEKMITDIITDIVGKIKVIAFVYERKKVWKTIVIAQKNEKIEIPITQFSIYDVNKFKKEFRKYWLALNIINSPISAYHYPSKVNYYVVINQIQAKDLGMGWIRKAFREGLDIAVEQGKYSLIYKDRVEALNDYIIKRHKTGYIYNFDKISVSIGFWSYDLLVGSAGNILIVKNRKEKEELMKILSEEIKKGLRG